MSVKTKSHNTKTLFHFIICFVNVCLFFCKTKRSLKKFNLMRTTKKKTELQPKTCGITHKKKALNNNR